MLKDFHRKSTVTNKFVYERNYRIFNNNEFKNDLKNILWKIFRVKLTCQQVQRLICFSNKLIHVPIHKLSKKELSLKKKPWTS